MGEIAEMMLDGTLCECCGEFIHDGEAEGFPRYCSPQCAADRGQLTMTRKELRSAGRVRNIGCPDCSKKFSSDYALVMHWQAKHDKKETGR
jgi:hypothetical protein